jgi:acyl-[acyl-carrier-protein]-phospholipid O-acyltransferase/long-chain-fatty-acid--[acyl-carrier-protein] ligase
MNFRFINRTLFSALMDAADQYGYRTRIIEDAQGNSDTYGGLIRASLVLGRLLARHTAELEHVGVLLPNINITVSLLMGLTAWRRTPALLNYSADAEVMRHACAAAAIRIIITSRKFVGAVNLDQCLSALIGIRIIYLEDLRRDLTWRGRLKAVVEVFFGRRRFGPRALPDDPAVVLFTSGSEGAAKGVVLSHRALLANIWQMREVFPFDRDDKFFSPLPVYHSYGLTACVLMPLLAGTPIHLYISPLHYHEIPAIVRTQHCRVLFGTSTFLGQYARHARVADFASVKYVISGGEKLDEKVVILWQEHFGLQVYDGYGCTECAPVVALNVPLAHRAGTVGRFLPGIEYRLLPVEGFGQGGRLLVRGPNLMLGYYLLEQPGKLRPPQAEIDGGWHDTGDIVEVTPDGYVSILGRANRFAKIAGEMIALDMVERIAMRASPQHQHAAIVEVVSGSGESTVLFTTDFGLTRSLLQHAARLLGSHHLAVARRIVHVVELPRSGSGKTDYVKLNTLSLNHEKNFQPD